MRYQLLSRVRDRIRVDPGNVAAHLAVIGVYVVAGMLACRATFTRRLDAMTTTSRWIRRRAGPVDRARCGSCR